MEIKAVDGTRLHAEVFGPEHGQPIVFAHGITCAICTGTWLPSGNCPVAIKVSMSRIQCSCGGRKFAT